MTTKRQVLMDVHAGEGCLGKAAMSEPVFILRAQDAHAAYIVERWANLAYATAPKKAAQAREIADAMRRWPNRKLPD